MWFRSSVQYASRRIGVRQLGFGISDALAIYSGGFGILASEHLRSAGVLNETAGMPIRSPQAADGGSLRMSIELIAPAVGASRGGAGPRGWFAGKLPAGT